MDKYIEKWAFAQVRCVPIYGRVECMDTYQTSEGCDVSVALYSLDSVFGWLGTQVIVENVVLST
jgi:hypothetical protein